MLRGHAWWSLSPAFTFREAEPAGRRGGRQQSTGSAGMKPWPAPQPHSLLTPPPAFIMPIKLEAMVGETGMSLLNCLYLSLNKKAGSGVTLDSKIH